MKRERAHTHSELHRTVDEDELWMLGLEPSVTGLEDTDPQVMIMVDRPPRRTLRGTGVG